MITCLKTQEAPPYVKGQEDTEYSAQSRGVAILPNNLASLQLKSLPNHPITESDVSRRLRPLLTISSVIGIVNAMNYQIGQHHSPIFVNSRLGQIAMEKEGPSLWTSTVRACADCGDSMAKGMLVALGMVLLR